MTDNSPGAFQNRGASAAQPLITIAIPTRNRASLLKNCVRNALAQTYSNIEVLVSDNASTDDSLTILKSFNDQRLRVLTSSEDVGHINNFNKCIREAKGDYIVLLSDDNTIDSTFLSKCVRLVQEEPDLPIVVAAYDVLIIDEHSKNEMRTVPAVVSKKLTNGIWDGKEILMEYLRGKLTAQTLSSIIRVDFLRRRGGYSTEHHYACDEEALILAMLEGRAGLVNERCATYMVHASRMSAARTADSQLMDLGSVMEKIAAAAEWKISDRATRCEIQRLTLCYLAYRAIQELAFYRRNGASLFDVVRRVWRWRSLLARCRFVDFLAASRLRVVARVLLPTPMIRLARLMGVH